MAAVSVVTGAFGFSGRHIATKLLERGRSVRTLTNHSDPKSPLYAQCKVAPLDFANPENLARSMEGAEVLYNTYWVRFAYKGIDHTQAVENSRVLIRAAEKAGVRRIVHVSISNPSPSASTPYFRGKAAVEEVIRASSMSYAILRPTVLFGHGDILINNIAYLLRRFPIFAIPGDGEYKLQPVYVEDLAELAVNAGERQDCKFFDAVGPEIYTYAELVKLIRGTVGSHSRIVHVPTWLMPLLSRPLGWMLDDVVLTSDEVRELTGNVLVSSGPPTSTASLRAWLRENAGSVGMSYASELARHFGGSNSSQQAR